VRIWRRERWSGEVEEVGMEEEYSDGSGAS